MAGRKGAMRHDDDHEAFDRPRRRTQPRTKVRPTYDDAAIARVITIDRGRYTVHLDDRTALTAVKARTLGRQGVVVGDVVRVVGDLTGADGTLARIVEVEERDTVLRRTADDDDPIERIVVANADQLMVVAALADPPPRPGLIDRCLVAAFDAGMTPLVCLTKADLADPTQILAELEPLDVGVLVTRRGDDLAEIRAALSGHTTVLVGHSGVGKSTLVNALVPDADRVTSHVNEVTGRGRHTSTSAISLELPPPGAGRIIDTPGIRSFGLAHVEPSHLIRAFPDLDEVAAGCPRGCTHAADEPECALDTAAADGRLAEARVASFRRIWASRDQLA